MNPISVKTTQPILMTKTYIIDSTKQVMRKIQEPIPLIRTRKKLL